MARAKPGKQAAAKPGGRTKAKTSATSAKPSARSNKPVATSKPTKSAASSAPRPTISARAETARTRAPTAAPRPQRDTLVEARIDVAPHEATASTARDHSAEGVEGADPARAAELAALEAQVDTLENPDLLVALASRIDALGMQLAYEISRHAHDAAHIAPLKPVLLAVPALYGRTLLRASEKFDDLGSPRRAAYVLFEALRKAFDPDVITAVANALSFVLEAHGQTTPALAIRALLAEREDRRARGVDRREVRMQFAAALEELRDRGVDWDALDDVADQFD